MTQFRNASSNGSLRPPDGGTAYPMPQRPARARQLAQVLVAAVAFVLIGVVLAQVIGGTGDDSDNLGGVPVAETSTAESEAPLVEALTPTVTVPSVTSTTAQGTPSAEPSGTVEQPPAVLTEQPGSPTSESTVEPTPVIETPQSIEPGFATLSVWPDYVTCEDEVIARGMGFAPGTTVVLYGGPLLGDNFGQLSVDIPVADDGGFEAAIDVGRMFAQCGGADIDEEDMQYGLGAETGSSLTKEEFEGPSALAAITFSSSTPATVKTRTRLSSCGVEVQRNETMLGPASGPDEAMRRCFVDAVEVGAQAEFISYRQTVEGDVVTTIYRSLGAGNVEVIVDATRDRFGSGEWTMSTCTGTTLSEETLEIEFFTCGQEILLERE